MEPLAHHRIAELRRQALLIEVERAHRAAPPARARGFAPTRAILYPLTAVLAVATAVALVALVATMPSAAGGPVPTGTSDEAATRRFYAALNRAIASGDLDLLETAVWPELAVHRSDGQTWGLDELRRHLLALHAGQPGGALRVERVFAADHRAIAEVALVGAGRERPLAVHDGVPAAHGRHDHLRVADGRVVEYAGVAVETSASRAVIAGDAAVPRHGVVRVELFRVTLQPGAKLPMYVAGGPLLYAVESGEISLWSIAAREATGSGEHGLRPGDQAVLRPGASHSLRTVGPDPTTVFAAMLLPDGALSPLKAWGMDIIPPAESPPRQIWPPGVEVVPVGGGDLDWQATGATEPGRVAVDRLVLPPGRHRVLGPPAGVGLLTVESGQGVLVPPPGSASASGSPEPLALLAPGSSTVPPPGRPLLVDNVGADPLALLVTTLMPTDPSPAPGGRDGAGTVRTSHPFGSG